MVNLVYSFQLLSNVNLCCTAALHVIFTIVCRESAHAANVNCLSNPTRNTIVYLVSTNTFLPVSFNCLRLSSEELSLQAI